jgi:UDP-N-acetyl-D-glucosamine dehydrogenase
VNAIVGIVGQGYVGLPLALAVSKAGFKVIGIDNDKFLVELLNSGKSRIEGISDSEILKQIRAKKYEATLDVTRLKECEVKIICVPTPLMDSKPDLSFLIDAVQKVGKYLNKSDLVLIESTIEPGTTRNLVIPLLEKESGIKREDFYVIFSPERIDPANHVWNLSNTPKLVAGMTPEATKLASNFYSSFIDSIIECDSFEVAETAKLLENTFRLINISFINEISVFCHKLSIDVNEVIKAAATKPHGFMAFYPGIGVGGHCIPVDPIYLARKANEVGAPTRFIELADQINQEVPGYFVGRAEAKIGGLMEKKVLVVGVAYKPNVADVRETPVKALISGLRDKGAIVNWHDDLVKEWNGEKSIALSTDYDLAIIATAHDYLDLANLENVPILNTRGSI